MPGIDIIGRWQHRPVVGSDGATIGRIAEIYLDDRTDQPGWALVTSVTAHGNLVPITAAVERGAAVQVPYDSHRVTSAPGMSPAGSLSEDEEAALHHHYGLAYLPRPSEFEQHVARANMHS